MRTDKDKQPIDKVEDKLYALYGFLPILGLIEYPVIKDLKPLKAFRIISVALTGFLMIVSSIMLILKDASIQEFIIADAIIASIGIIPYLSISKCRDVRKWLRIWGNVMYLSLSIGFIWLIVQIMLRL